MLIGIIRLLSRMFFIFGYLGGAYPESLSPEAERELIDKMTAGDDAAREQLILHNLRLVAHVAKKYSTSRINQEDLLSIGTIGLIKGINTFDAQKSSRLSHYVARCIDNEILMAIRSEGKHGGNVFLDDVIGTDSEGNSITLIDVVSDEEEDIPARLDLEADCERLSGLLDKLTEPREAQIIALRYGLPDGKRHTQKQTAELLGISRSYVSRLEKRAVEKLSELFFDGYGRK